VWADTAVTDDALTTCIQELRRALQDDARHPRFIEKTPKDTIALELRGGGGFLGRSPRPRANDGRPTAAVTSGGGSSVPITTELGTGSAGRPPVALSRQRQRSRADESDTPRACLSGRAAPVPGR
jgi:hypothetical protein